LFKLIDQQEHRQIFTVHNCSDLTLLNRLPVDHEGATVFENSQQEQTKVGHDRSSVRQATVQGDQFDKHVAQERKRRVLDLHEAKARKDCTGG